MTYDSSLSQNQNSHGICHSHPIRDSCSPWKMGKPGVGDVRRAHSRPQTPDGQVSQVLALLPIKQEGKNGVAQSAPQGTLLPTSSDPRTPRLTCPQRCLAPPILDITLQAAFMDLNF